MHRILEKFANLMNTAIIFVYLFSLYLGTATYFVGHAVGLNIPFLLSVGFWVAGAVEVHSFLSQRKTRSLWQQLHKMDETDDGYENVQSEFRLHLWITIGLVVFSMINAISFWIMDNHPQGFWEYAADVLRGAVVPAFFLCAGFLTPLNHDAGQLLADTAHSMLHKTTKAMSKQWKTRIKQAQKQKIDLAPIAIALMQEEGDHKSARRISLIAEALSNAEGVRSIAAPKQAQQPALTVPQKSLRLASTDAAPVATMTPPLELDDDPDALQMEVEDGQPKAVTQRASSTRRAAKSNGSEGRKPYPARSKKTPEQLVRDAITQAGGVDNIKPYQIAKATKVSTSTADKYWKKVKAGE